MANKPKIKLKVSDIEIENMRDGEPSIGSLSSNSNDILVQIKDETAGTRKSIEKLNDVMSRLVDAFSASLMLQKKETTRQIAKDQREKTKDDIADDVKKRKGSSNVTGAIMSAAANPFAVLGEGLRKMSAGLGGLVGSILGAVGGGLLKFLSKGLWKVLRGNLGKFLPTLLSSKLDDMFSTVDIDQKNTQGTAAASDGKPKKEKPKGNWKKAFGKLARGLGTVARFAGVVGLPFLAYEVIEFISPYARKSMQERMKEATEREEKIAKEINESISKFKKEQMDMQTKLNAAVLAGDETLIKNLETEMAKEKAKFSEELKKKQTELDAARAELQRERQAQKGIRENRLSDEQRLASQQAVDMGVEVGRNQGILNKGKVQDYLDLVKKDASTEELQEFIKSQGGMDKFGIQIRAYAPGILGNTDPQGELLKIATTGENKEKEKKQARLALEERKAERSGQEGIEGPIFEQIEEQKKQKLLDDDIRREQAKALGDQDTNLIGLYTDGMEEWKNMQMKKYSPDFRSDLGRSRKTGLWMDDTYSAPTPSAVRVDDFGSMPERSKGLIESVANTVTDAFSWLKGKLKKEEEIEIQKVKFNKEETEYMKKVSQDIETLNKFFTEGNNVMIINKGGDTVINDGRVTNLNNSQQMALGSGSVFPIVG